MSPDDWQSILDDSRGDEWRHATLTYDGVVVEDVGVRPVGRELALRGNPKMSIRIKFDAFDGRGISAATTTSTSRANTTTDR